MATIRNAKLEDVSAIAEIYVACGIDFKRFTEPVIRKQYEKNPSSFLVAEEDEKVVGTAYVQANGMFGSVWKVGVLPSYRRKGIAKALMNEAMSRIEDAGCLGVAVLSNKNKAAIKLYESVGMEKVDDVPMFRRLPG